MAQSVTRRAALKKFGLGIAGMALACFGLANKAAAVKQPKVCTCRGGLPHYRPRLLSSVEERSLRHLHVRYGRGVYLGLQLLEDAMPLSPWIRTRGPENVT